MPAEWHPHTACWMAWPCAADTFSRAPLSLKAAHREAKKCYAEVAKAISRFEPVYMLTNKTDLEETQVMCGPGVEVVESEIDDDERKKYRTILFELHFSFVLLVLILFIGMILR